MNKDFLELLQEDYTKYKTFIETRTHNVVEKLFEKIYTIEKNNFEILLPIITTPSIFLLDSVLNDEIDMINNYFTNDAIILLDKHCNFSEYNILLKLKDRLEKVYFLDDIMVIHIHKR